MLILHDAPMSEGALERIRGGAAADEMTVLAALREEVQRLAPLAKIEVSGSAGKEQIRIERGPGETGAVSLHNLWKQLRGASGEEAVQAIERFARMCAHDFSSLESASEAAKVMPLVLDRARVEALDSDLACREISTCGTLFVCLVLDAPDHVRYLNVSDLDEHGFGDPAEAEEKAIANLGSDVSASGQLRVESEPILPEESRGLGFLEGFRDILVHRVRLDGDYDASLPLLTGLAQYLCDESESPLAHLDGPRDMAFALPARGTFLIVDGREEHASEALSPMARASHLNEAYAISPQVYRYARSDERLMLEPVDLQ